ncbi:uncharacterized protein LOC134239503 [Saccostrea cucullata]|uniref:uncharacterized protein LOC134239503 n=1 Tax=Saccostrea cuccullata TaxID=36930 RepID=UPI002ED2AD56
MVNMTFLVITAFCVGGCISFIMRDKLECALPSQYRMKACLNKDPCCSVLPVFEKDCFTGCQLDCRNSIFCKRTCPVLEKSEVQDCVNTDPYCFVEKIIQPKDGKDCFSGCIKACS